MFGFLNVFPDNLRSFGDGSFLLNKRGTKYLLFAELFCVSLQHGCALLLNACYFVNLTNLTKPLFVIFVKIDVNPSLQHGCTLLLNACYFIHTHIINVPDLYIVAQICPRLRYVDQLESTRALPIDLVC